MKKVDFYKEFKEKAGLNSNVEAKRLLDILGDLIVEHLRDEDGISPFMGIKFKSIFQDARTRRNPRTGGTIDVPPKYVPKVKFGDCVRRAINE